MQRLLTYTLESGDTSLIDKMPRALMTEQELEWLDWVEKHKQVYGDLPSLNAFKLKFPTFIELGYGSKNDLLHQTIERKKKQEIHNTLAMIDPNNVEEAKHEIEKLVSKLSLGPSHLLGVATISRKKLYAEKGKGKFLVSHALTKKIGGIKNGEVAIVFGRYASAKSSVAENTVVKWLLDGEKVLFVANDMSLLSTLKRLDSYLIHKDVDKMSEKELEILDKVLPMLYNGIDGQLIIPENPIEYAEEIAGIVQETGATAVVVDGVYLMKSSSSKTSQRDWQALSEVSGVLTRLAHEKGITVLLVTQANRSGDIGFTMSFAQDADLMIYMNDDIEAIGDEESKKIVQVQVKKNRRGPNFSGYITLDFDNYEIYDTKFVNSN